MHKSVRILIALCLLSCQTWLHAQNGGSLTTRIITLGGDPGSRTDIRRDATTQRLIIAENPDGLHPSGILNLCLDSFPALQCLEIWNLSTAVLSLSGREKSPLRSLIISNSPAFSLDKALSFLAQRSCLEQLTLEGLTDPRLPAKLRRLRCLNSISVINCDQVEMQSLMDALKDQSGLEHLCIRGNFDLRFPPRYQPRRYFHRLDFSDNYLTTFPAWMLDPEGMSSLDLRDNELYLPDVLYPMRRIRIDTLYLTAGKASDTILVRQLFPDAICYFEYDTLTPEASMIRFTGGIAGYDDRDTKVFRPVRNSFQPPVDKADPEFRRYRANQESDQVFRTLAGSRITIEANSLVNARGESISGDYDLYFREFTDLGSLFFSGIPMTYDSGGNLNYFETGGMFEIYALQDSNPLQVRPGKEIRVELASLSREKGFNLYQYNDTSGHWEYTSALANEITVSKRPAVYSGAYKYLYLLKTYPFDTCTFEQRHEFPQYARTRKMVDYFWGVKKDLYPYFKIRKMRSSGRNRDRIFFRLPYRYSGRQHKYVITTSAYREMSIYSSYEWEYKGAMTKQDFLREYCRLRKWTDIRIEYDEASKEHVITLKSPNQEKELSAVLLMPNIKDQEKYAKTVTKMDVRYRKSLERTAASFNRSLAKRKERDQRKDWKTIRTVMSSEEREMPVEDWLIYANKALENSLRSDSQFVFTGSEVTRALSLNGFGIWNVDRKVEYPNSQNVLAEVRDENDQPVQLWKGWLVNRSAAGVIPLELRNGKVKYTSPENMTWAMCFVDHQNRLYVSHMNQVGDVVQVTSSKVLRCSLLEDPSNEALHNAMGF